MSTIEHRFYVPETISNIFAIGERIEWIQNEWRDEFQNHHIEFGKGTIVHIRQRVVIIEEEFQDGSTEYWRIERFYLFRYVNDPNLKAAINAHGIVSSQSPSKVSKKVATKIDNRRYSVYALVDPRDDSFHYIGIAIDPIKRFREHLTCIDLNFKKNSWIQDLLAQGLQPRLVIIEIDIVSSKKAEERERHWIEYYLDKDAPLANFAKTHNWRMKNGRVY